MSQPSLLDGAEWRAFRLFLVDLEDIDLASVERQLRREIASRQEYARDVTRLFFSSLRAADLEIAQQTIRAERRARASEKTRAASWKQARASNTRDDA